MPLAPDHLNRLVKEFMESRSRPTHSNSTWFKGTAEKWVEHSYVINNAKVTGYSLRKNVDSYWTIYTKTISY